MLFFFSWTIFFEKTTPLNGLETVEKIICELFILIYLIFGYIYFISLCLCLCQYNIFKLSWLFFLSKFFVRKSEFSNCFIRLFWLFRVPWDYTLTLGIFLQTLHWDYDRHFIESIVCLWYHWHFNNIKFTNPWMQGVSMHLFVSSISVSNVL